MDRILSRQEVASAVKVSTRTVDRWIRAGDLHALKLGGVLRVREADLVAFLDHAAIKAPNVGGGEGGVH